MKTVLVLLILILLNFPVQVRGQAISKTDSISLQQALEKIKSHYDLKILYKPEWIKDMKVFPPGNFSGIEKDMNNVLTGTGLTFYNYKNLYLVLYHGSIAGSTENLPGRHQKNYSNIIYLLSGQVLSEKEETPILGATVFIQELDTGTVTDINGFFRFSIPEGSYSLDIKSVGYIEQHESIALTENTDKKFYLPTEVVQLNEVVVKGKAQDFNVNNLTGVTILSSRSLKEQPPFMGEADVIHGLLMLPGVTSVGEASPGFNVRGGNADENLVLLDGAPIYNNSHVFGLFSGFNNDMVDNVTLLRAGIPARYGGRISSVLDVETYPGQVNRFTGVGGIGLFDSRLALKIPVIKDRLTLVTGGRISYSDYLLHLVNNIQIKNSSAFFYDGNVKMNFKISGQSQVRYSYYSSYDNFRIPFDTLYHWSTVNHSISFNQLIGKKLVVNAEAVLANYNYGLNSDARTSSFTWKAGIADKELRIDSYYQPWKSHRIEFGIGSGWHTYSPGALNPGESSSINRIIIPEMHSRDLSGYAEDEFDLSPSVTIMGGLRYTYYSLLGPGDVNQYEAGLPKSDLTLTGSEHFDKGKSIRNYSSLSPRFSIRFLMNNNSSVKISYNRMYQYIQVITNTAAITPISLWLPSGPYILPQWGDEASIGYFRNFNDNTIETSAEIYFKRMGHIVDYKDGADLFQNPNIENQVLEGKGRAYGIELYAKKDFGRVTGWLSYTYSRSLIQVKGPTPEETINEGKYYPANYDRPNDFKMTAIYRINRRWNISGNFIFSTGRPVTYPSAKYEIDNITIANFGDRNLDRTPDYNRLDLSVTLNGNNKKNKWWEGSWTFSIYNVYARENAYSVFFKPKAGTKLPQAYQYSILGTALPSLTYNFRFL